MRQETVNIYKFDELPEDIQEKVIEKWRESAEFCWIDEYVDSLKAFADHFGLDKLDYEISLYGRSYCTGKCWVENIAELSGVGLFEWLNNSGLLETPEMKWDETLKKTVRTGKLVSLLGGQCPFTGWCGDESLLDPMRKFMEKPDDRTYQDLIDDCLNAWVSAVIRDMEWQMNDEYIKETIEVNEYEFTEDGEMV